MLARVFSSICTGKWKMVFFVYVILGNGAAGGLLPHGGAAHKKAETSSKSPRDLGPSNAAQF